MRSLACLRPTMALSTLCFALVACGDEAEETSPGGTPSDAGDALDSDTDDATSNAVSEPEAPANQPPSAVLSTTASAGPIPLAITFDGSDSVDPDGTIVEYDWDFGDGSSGSGESVDHTFAEAGCYEVLLTVTDDEGASDTATMIVVGTNGVPTDEPDVVFDTLPLDMALIPRDLTTDEGTIEVSGTVASPGYDSVVVEVTGSGTVVSSLGVPLCSTAPLDPFSVSVGIPAELESHELSVYLVAGQQRTLVQQVQDLVAGDVLLVQGQSNAVAMQRDGDANVNAGPFLRSFGSRTEDGAATGRT